MARQTPASPAVVVNFEHWDWEVPAVAPLAVSPLGGPEGLWRRNRFPDIGGYGNHGMQQPGRDLSKP